MPTTARLPGIQFDVVAPPAADALVRMDIAVFVGFAASGPVDLPVPVESIAEFEEIFGSDLALANDPGSTQPVYAHLAPAVRAFFRNNGRRCWVVRVAGTGLATNQFPIPGLFTLNNGAAYPTLARARSQGSWADDLEAAIALRSHGILLTSFTSNPYVVGLTLQAPGEVSAGDLLRLTFPGGRDVLWLFVDSVSPVGASSPPNRTSANRTVEASGQTVFWEEFLSSPIASPPQGWKALTSPPSLSGLPVCELITMDMFARDGSGDIWTLTQLGFAPAHPRYFGNLPDDETIYGAGTLTGLEGDVAHPRFPLAGPDDGTFFLPIDAGALPTFAGARIPASDALTRNGLAVFGSNLFLDSALSETGSLDLLREADFLRYQSSAPRTLRGIHAALAVEEATIIAAPDAVQRGWFQVQDQPLASPPPSSPLLHPEWWHFLDCGIAQPIPRTSQPPAGEFQSCDLQVVAAPLLSLTAPENGKYSLVWTPLSGATDYLEEAVDPAFATSAVVYQGSSGQVTIFGRAAGDYYYRLRRQAGNSSSDYSNGVGVRIAGVAGWQTVAVSAYDHAPLLEIHSALLRMCAARGDMFSTLALPAHYRERDAMAHTTQLKTALGQAEEAAFSFGGVYHPWPEGREENDLNSIRGNPPDGAVCGIIANRSYNRGAWIPPANEPLRGVVALTPSISRAYWLALEDAQINLVRQEPAGFLCLAASTLSDDPDLQPINVRRLLSFLRKTALRVGEEYVFEPNSDAFRRGVQRAFEKLLDSLFLRGAFAGRTAREGFQVVTDSRVNTRTTIDRGQFFVDLLVAPAVPLRFLTVRLVQTGDRTSVTEGA